MKKLTEERYNQIKKAIEKKKQFSWVQWAYGVGTPIVERIKKTNSYEEYIMQDSK